MLKIKNETAKSAELYIYGTIVDDEDSSWLKFWSEENLDGYQFPADVKRQLDSLKGKDLEIYINSYGGSIAAGVAMANMIKRHEGKTTAIVDGYCCSIATQIFFCADECKMPSNAYLMIHKPWSVAQGDANEMRKVAEILDVLQNGLEETYNQKALEEVTSEAIHDMTEEETWLTGKEAAQYFKIEVLDAVKAVNCFGSTDKLKAIAKKIPPSLNFLPENNLAEKTSRTVDKNKIDLALARAKGMV